MFQRTPATTLAGDRGDPDRRVSGVRVLEQGETELLAGGEERAVEGRR